MGQPNQIKDKKGNAMKIIKTQHQQLKRDENKHEAVKGLKTHIFSENKFTESGSHNCLRKILFKK